MPARPNTNTVNALRDELVEQFEDAMYNIRDDRYAYKAFANAAKDARVTGWGRLYDPGRPLDPAKDREIILRRDDARRRIKHQIEMACIAQVIKYGREFRHWQTSRAGRIGRLLTSMGVNPSRAV